jgi:integration host factor subunit beta
MAEKVTKYVLIDSVHEATGVEKKVIQNVIESFLDEIKDSLKNKSTIELRGFGTFELRLRKEKKAARNPKTGEIVTVKPHYVAAFRSGQELKNTLWNLPQD